VVNGGPPNGGLFFAIELLKELRYKTQDTRLKIQACPPKPQRRWDPKKSEIVNQKEIKKRRGV
jgi:hypothetical protein